MYDKFEEIFHSYVNGQNKQCRAQLKKLSRAHRAECLDYIRIEFDEDVIAFKMAIMVIKGL